MFIANDHNAIVALAIDATRNDRVCRANSGRPSEWSAAINRLIVGEIINLSAQFASLYDLARADRADFFAANGPTIEADKYL